MYTSWWRCFFQNVLDNPASTAMGIHALGMLVGMGLAISGVFH